jgi:hypothetical protein
MPVKEKRVHVQELRQELQEPNKQEKGNPSEQDLKDSEGLQEPEDLKEQEEGHSEEQKEPDGRQELPELQEQQEGQPEEQKERDGRQELTEPKEQKERPRDPEEETHSKQWARHQEERLGENGKPFLMAPKHQPQAEEPPEGAADTLPVRVDDWSAEKEASTLPVSGAAGSACTVLSVRLDEIPECRICRGEESPLIRACACRGSIGLVHEECLQEWIAAQTSAHNLRLSNTEEGTGGNHSRREVCCEICHERYLARSTISFRWNRSLLTDRKCQDQICSIFGLPVFGVFLIVSFGAHMVKFGPNSNDIFALMLGVVMSAATCIMCRHALRPYYRRNLTYELDFSHLQHEVADSEAAAPTPAAATPTATGV